MRCRQILPVLLRRRASAAATMAAGWPSAAAVGTPVRIRTRTRFGPTRAGSGPLSIAATNDFGSTWNGMSTPVPMEVWSETVLANPMAGNVAVPTIRSRVGGM